ncbi:MAG: glycosyltransferase [Alphaproteobacteria bacterium]|nr:glycosyltransferase [Alphaproteobacteria bacterium]
MPQPYAIIFPFLGAGVGGSHVVTFRLGRALDEFFGLKSLVLCVEGSKIAEEARRYGLDVAAHGERAVSRNNPFYDLTKVAHRVALLKRYGDRDTIVHANDIETTQSWGPCAKLAGMKLVYQHQSLNRDALPNRIALAFPDAFIAVSDPCLNNLHYVDQTKIVKILYSYTVKGVDRTIARANVLADADVPQDSILLGFVGNFWNRKRPHYFIDVAKAIAPHEPRARFLMFGRAGENSEDDMKAYAAEQGVADRVVFMGFRSPPEENVAALDVMLAPAINEPFGLTPVESLLLATPYVITADAGHLESGERWKGGLLVPKDAPPDVFAQSVMRIIRGEVSPVLSPERRAEIARELSPRAQADQVLALYRRLRPRAPAFAIGAHAAA